MSSPSEVLAVRRKLQELRLKQLLVKQRSKPNTMLRRRLLRPNLIRSVRNVKLLSRSSELQLRRLTVNGNRLKKKNANHCSHPTKTNYLLLPLLLRTLNFRHLLAKTLKQS